MNWPLRLTPIEELFFIDDRPAYPCCGFLRARLSGELDQARMEAAIRATLPRHPLLTAHIERHGSGLVWVPAQDSLPAIAWSLSSPPEGFPAASQIDLRTETGLRLQGYRHGSESALYFQFHHAVCDGIGIFQLLHEILLEYAAAQERPAFPFDHWDRARRGIFARPLTQQLSLIPQHLRNLRTVSRFIRRSPSALCSHPAAPHHDPPGSGHPATVTARLTSEETVAVQQAARRLGVTVNDLLLRDLFLALQAWRKAQGFHAPDHWLRLLVPVNLRTPADGEVPASNILSLVFLDRCGLNFDDPDALLRGVSDEMNGYKQRHMGQMLPLALALGRHLPGGLKKHVWANKCLVSSMLSNLGKLFEHSPLRGADGRLVAGEVTLQSVEVFPPVRPHMQAAFAVGTYAGLLWATLHHDARAISQTQAHALMNAFHQQVLSSSATTA